MIIKFCPFCGHDQARLHTFHAARIIIKVVCDFCGAEGPDNSTDDDAVDGWNNRSEATP